MPRLFGGRAFGRRRTWLRRTRGRSVRRAAGGGRRHCRVLVHGTNRRRGGRPRYCESGDGRHRPSCCRGADWRSSGSSRHGHRERPDGGASRRCQCRGRAVGRSARRAAVLRPFRVPSGQGVGRDTSGAGMGRWVPSPTSDRVHRVCRRTVSLRVGLLVLVAQASFRNAGPGQEAVLWLGRGPGGPSSRQCGERLACVGGVDLGSGFGVAAATASA